MNVNDGAKRILCFGDSNTWGLTPMSNDLRYAPSLRWTGRLQLILGKEFEIIEEGLNSRYIDKSDSREGKEGKNAEEYILPCIDSHDPLDKIVIMLGTNDIGPDIRLALTK
jgi:lysophospholipase L1-like esterase